jgi:hypothetical protein
MRMESQMEGELCHIGELGCIYSDEEPLMVHLSKFELFSGA